MKRRGWGHKLGTLAASTTLLFTTASVFGTASGASASSYLPNQKAVLVSTQATGDKGVVDHLVAGFRQGIKKYHFAAGKVVVDQDPSTYVSLLRTLASGGFNFIMVTFPPMIQAISTVAPEYPKVHFVLLDAQIPKPLPNVQTEFFYENQSSFLAGAVAAYMTKTHKVGFIGGVVQNVINRYLDGYYQGVKYVDPKDNVCWTYTNNLQDPALGKQVALQMYHQGIDVIHAATAGTELGIYEASIQAHKYLIGADVNILPFDPKYGLTATGPHFAHAAQVVLAQQAEGKFKAGRYQYGLSQEAVGIQPFNRVVPKAVQQKVDHLKQLIIEGKIVVHGGRQANQYVSKLQNCHNS